VVSHHGVEYVDAFCHSAEAPRLFRLDRIHEARVLDSAVTTEPTRSRDLSDGMFASGEEATLVTLELEPQARWVEEYYAVEAVRARPDGGSEVDLLVADERWLQRLLMRLAPDARVASPAGYGAGATQAIRAALDLYDHPAG
jgi:proteasome accessory factor C